MSENKHKPVLIESLLIFLQSQNFNFKEKFVFDGTFGGGGYTQKFLNLNSKIYACDWDKDAYEKGLAKFNQKIKENKLSLVNLNFKDYIKEFTNDFFDLIVLDLGFSSNQLEFSGRGFSYQKLEEPLDLRYSSKIHSPVWKKIKALKDSRDLARILFKYSGEKYSQKIAEDLYRLTRAKKNQEKIYVKDLVKIIDKIIKDQKMRLHSLSRIWQALRIWVNHEFENLESFLFQSIPRLKNNGYLVIVSFHSLEDKIVTKFMRAESRPKIIDEYGNKKHNFELLTKDAIVPQEEEVSLNPRSRSAKLRILKKL